MTFDELQAIARRVAERGGAGDSGLLLYELLMAKQLALSLKNRVNEAIEAGNASKLDLHAFVGTLDRIAKGYRQEPNDGE